MSNHNDPSESGVDIHVIYEGENFSVYRIEEEDGEASYDIQIFDLITLHLGEDEWLEFVDVMHGLKGK